MIRYLLTCVWTVALVGSFAGWGAVAGRVLLGRREGDFGERVAWGIALTVALGGLANLLRLISPSGLIGYAAAGLALFLVDAALRLRDPRPEPLEPPPGGIGRLAVGLVVGLAVVRVAASAYTLNHTQLDDHTGYLVFPVQMLETGGLTRDPFCDRRLESALGGGYILNAFAVAVFREESAKLVDLGVGFLAMLAGVLGLARSRGLIAGTWVLPALLVEIDGAPPGNLTPQLIPIALLLAIHRMLGRDERSIGRAAMLGLLAAALVSLKSTLLPIAFFVFALDFLPRIGRAATWRALPIEIAVGLACLAPWMIALKQSSGTYLFPLLGKGVHGTAYGTFYDPKSDMTWEVIQRNAFIVLTDPMVAAAGLTALAAFSTWFGPRREGDGERRRPEDFALIVAPLPSLLVMLCLVAVNPIKRYSYPVLLASMVVSLASILRRTGDPGLDNRRTMLALACVAFFVGARWPDERLFYQLSAHNIRGGLSGRPYVPEAERAAYSAMQAAVPAGEPILAHLKQMYVLDFRRNPVYVADWPGGASPPPGMPVFRGPEPLAAYLTGQGIRYIAYSYADHANFPERNRAGIETWERIATEHGYAFQDSLAALMESRRNVYRDDALVVIDLAAPAPP
jgi:hypothetical protein